MSWVIVNLRNILSKYLLMISWICLVHCSNTRLLWWTSAKLSALILIGLAKLLFGLHDLFCCGIALICSRHLENPRPILFALKYRNVAAVGNEMLSVFLPIQQNRPIQPSIHLGRILFLTGLSCWRFSISFHPHYFKELPKSTQYIAVGNDC